MAYFLQWSVLRFECIALEFTRSLLEVYSKFTKSLPKVYQKFTPKFTGSQRCTSWRVLHLKTSREEGRELPEPLKISLWMPRRVFSTDDVLMGSVDDVLLMIFNGWFSTDDVSIRKHPIEKQFKTGMTPSHVMLLTEECSEMRFWKGNI